MGENAVPKTTEADGGPIIFVNQPETTDGWTAEEVAEFREWLARETETWREIRKEIREEAGR